MKPNGDKFLETFGSLFAGPEWQPHERDRLLESVRHRRLAAGDAVMREGETCGAVPFVISGAIRVYKVSETGREITLYRIGPGQSCILSCCCAQSAAPFPAVVVAEEETEAAFLPADSVRRFFEKSKAFRTFVLGQYSSRMAEVIELVEEVAFRRLDERMHEWMLGQLELAGGRGKTGGSLKVTHQELADHLGTSREVVSRILKDWEQRGLLELSRGEIRLLPRFDSLPV
jgi:CRP/FNR family transcriptional regulator